MSNCTHAIAIAGFYIGLVLVMVAGLTAWRTGNVWITADGMVLFMIALLVFLATLVPDIERPNETPEVPDGSATKSTFNGERSRPSTLTGRSTG
jgi:hypothetical protein